MTLNELRGYVHLPTLVGHCGLGTRFNFFKLPKFGWYGRATDTGYTFEFTELLRGYLRISHKIPADDGMRLVYRYVSQQHRELLERNCTYSETNENIIAKDFVDEVMHQTLYTAARDEALHGNTRYNDRVHKFTKLMDDFGMGEFVKSGIGLISQKVVIEMRSKKFKIDDRLINKMIIPSFFTPSNRLASLETCEFRDIANRKHFYLNEGYGWYGRFGETLVGGVSDLLTIGGCTWSPLLGCWGMTKPVVLHHSLQPAQCIDIWLNSNGLPTDKNPLHLLKETDRLSAVKNHLKDLTLTQLRQLEKETGQTLYQGWVDQRYEETQVSGMKFACRDTKYHYQRGASWLEFTNFCVNLSHLKKEDGEWYQYGVILMNNQEVPFKAKRKHFVGHHALIQTLTDILLEAGVGVPTIAPNLRHYLVNVIDAFNVENRVEKPAVVAKEEPDENLARNIEPSL